MNIEQKLPELATTKGITRRAFMERALALGATTALATTLSGQAFAEPKQGGRFRAGLGHGRPRIHWTRRRSSTSTCRP